MNSSEESSTASFIWCIDDVQHSNNDEVESDVFQVGNCNLKFKLRLRKLRIIREGNISFYFSFVLLRKLPSNSGSFEFFIGGGVLERIITQARTSFSFNNKDPGEHFITKVDVITKVDQGVVILVEWNRGELKEPYSSGFTPSFNWLQESGEFSDVDIETEDGSRFPVHQAIISSRSRVFLAMLKSDMLEAVNKCIKITDLSTEIIKCMITYMYTNRLPALSCDSASELLKAADMYELDDLKEACGVILSENIDDSNAVDLLRVGDAYREKKLKENVLRYICRNFKRFSDAGKFEILAKNNPSLLAEITSFFAGNYSPK